MLSRFTPSRLLLWSFFFSSRRRHTRFSRDWSSDVCSSDLPSGGICAETSTARKISADQWTANRLQRGDVPQRADGSTATSHRREIGRASCRESETIWVVAAFLHKKDGDDESD